MKILIVDDDKIIREQIKGQIDWNETTVFAGEAANGKDALTAFRSFGADLIITDIYMPVMSGVELIKAVKSIAPQTQILVMSNYDDFQYVKDAMRFGAYDYVLKYKINASMLSGLLTAAEERIHDVRIQEEERSRLTELVQNQQRRYISEILRDICSGRCNENQVKTIAETRQMPLLSGQFFVFYILHTFPGFLSKVLDLWDYVCGAELAEDEAILLAGIQYKSALQIQAELYRMAKELTDLMGDERYMIVYGTSPVRIDTISSQVEMLRLQSGQYFYQGKAVFQCDPQVVFGILDEDKLSQYEDELINTIRRCDPVAYAEVAIRLAALLRECGAIPSQTRRVLRKVLYDMISQMREMPYSTEEYQAALQRLDESIDWRMTLEDIMAQVKQIMDVYFAHEKDSAQMRPEVAEAVRYMLQHYNENMSLQDLADHVGLSKNHFCTIFREQTGDYFIDFLNKVRIEEAKKLLKANMQVQEVAYAVGMNDPRYFSKLFKKYVKILPKDYMG